MSDPRILICPYCGEAQPHGQVCRACGGLFDALSRQATHNAMGPWFLRESRRPFQPGCSYHTLVQLISRGRVARYTILRGPTTGQYWTVAKRVPGVAHLLGYCHGCGAAVDAKDNGCRHCGASFRIDLNRDNLGLPEFRPLPGEGDTGDETVGVVRETILRGISSFATDDELLGPAVAVAPVPSPDRFAAPAEPLSEADVLLSPAGRSLQRTLAQAQRLTRRLLVLVALCVVVIAILAAPAIVRLAVRNSSDGGDVSEELASQRAADRAAPDRAAAPAEVVAQPAGTPPVELETPAPPSASTEPVFDPWAEMEEEAMVLAAIGADESRPTPDRIVAFERAIEVLRELEAAAPPERRPPDLQERIRGFEDAVERLRLKDFFP